MKDQSLYDLKKLKWKYLLLRSGESLLWALAAAGVIFGLSSAGEATISQRAIFSAMAGTAAFLIFFFRSGLNRTSDGRLISFINKQYPVMQHSTDLLFCDPAHLTSLQRIQKERVRTTFRELSGTIKFPHRIGQATLALFVSLGIAYALLQIDQHDSLSEKQRILQRNDNSSAILSADVKDISIHVRPPAYTGIAPYSTSDLHFSVPEGSMVEWKISFTDTVRDVRLLLSPADSATLTGTELTFRTSRILTASVIYQFAWETASGNSQLSDYYKVQVIKDAPPKIDTSELPEYTEIRIDDEKEVSVSVGLSDDYGLKDAYITATVSKGSGEAVKFREEKFLFTTPRRVRGRKARANRKIDLATLGLEPGDELYFYIEAVDIKSPLANRSRSKTFFIAVQDTASQTLSVEAGLGVDLMPAYFRSQRQIITDTEKLLREQKVVAQAEFNSRSNALGYDQKTLRLKYGEFLGEEFEGSIGPAHEPEEGGHEEGHSHQDEDEEEDPIAAYSHIHDDPEEATFFTQSIRSKLKAALAAMWESELHLRTFHPAKSLPFQYTALRLLKEISQASRIYVHKTGFDPPPLKEDKRLTGDLSEIRSSRHKTLIHPEENYPSIRSALVVLEEILSHADPALTAETKEVLFRAGQELAVLAIDQPGNYLHALSLIKALNEDAIAAHEVRERLIILRKIFWRAIPKEEISPQKATQSAHRLNHAFIETLKTSGDE